MDWHVYIVQCADGSYYTGISNDVKRRISEHNHSSTVGSKYAKTRRPVMLVYDETVDSRSLALKRERQIKKMPKNRKVALFSGP